MRDSRPSATPGSDLSDKRPFGHDPNFMTTAETAELLRVSIRTLERWRAVGEGPTHQLHGRRVVYPRESVLGWLANQETRGRKAAHLKHEAELKEVTACPYIKDRTRWHVDIPFVDPRTEEPDRVRRVAPRDKATLEDAIKWGEHERMKIMMRLCKGQSRREEGEPRNNKNQIPKLSDFWIDFEAAYISKQKLGTQQGYGQAWFYIRKVLTDHRLDQIGADALEALKDHMVDAGLEISTQRTYIAKLMKALRWAMAKGKLPRAVLPEVEFGKQRKRRVPIYSPEELEHMLGFAKDLYERVLVLLCMDACLRIGECAGLQWKDLSFRKGKHGTMEILRNVSGGLLQDTPKGEDGEVPLTPRLAAALQELKALKLHAIWVLPRRAKVRKPRSKNPRPIKDFSPENSLGKVVSRIQREAGLTPYGPHRVRHSRLTHLAERGVPLRALQHLARHARERTTERYYLHVNKLKMASAAIDELVNMTPTPPGNGSGGPATEPQIALVA